MTNLRGALVGLLLLALTPLMAACSDGDDTSSGAPLPSATDPAAGPVDPPAEPVGAATPDEAFQRARAANQKGEYATAFALLTRESQDEMLAGLLLAATATTLNHAGKPDPFRVAELDQIGLRYGIGEVEAPADGDIRAAIAASMAQVEDQARLFEALTRFLERATGEPARSKWVALEELDAGEDRATAVLVTLDPSGQEQRQPIALRRVAGRWFLHITEETTSGQR